MVIQVVFWSHCRCHHNHTYCPGVTKEIVPFRNYTIARMINCNYFLPFCSLLIPLPFSISSHPSFPFQPLFSTPIPSTSLPFLFLSILVVLSFPHSYLINSSYFLPYPLQMSSGSSTPFEAEPTSLVTGAPGPRAVLSMNLEWCS